MNEALDGTKTISRASIINFLNGMVEEGVLDYEEKTGKGGYRRLYRTRLDEKAFKKHLVTTVVSSLLMDFPDETREVLEEYLTGRAR